MGGLRSAKRKLNAKNVWIAQEVQRKKVELAQEFVKERLQKDAEFARDVLKAVGESLPDEYKKLADETIARDEKNLQEKAKIENESLVSVGGLVEELPKIKGTLTIVDGKTKPRPY